MERVKKLFDDLADDESEEVQRILREWYGPLLQLSLLYPSWKSHKVTITLSLFALYFVTLCVHYVILSVSVALLSDNFEMASLTFHFWLIFTFIMLTIPLVNLDRPVMTKVHRMFANPVGDYHPANIYEDEKLREIKEEQRKKFLKFLLLPGSVILMAAGVTVVPYMKNISEEEPGNTAFYTENNVNLHLPVAAYYPFPTHEGISHVLVVLGQLLSALVLAFVLGTLELISYRVSQAIIYEYQALQYGIGTIFARAEKMYKILYPNEIRSLDKHNFRFQRCVGVCLKNCIIHHHQIAVLVVGYESLMKWPGALAYSFGTGVIGLSLINILEALRKNNIEYLILFFLMSIIEVVNMYMISMFGEDITTESRTLRDSLYEIDWHELDITNQKDILNFQVGVTNPVIIKAGGLVAMCMDTFSSIINTAYSFFNLMNVNVK